MDDDRRPESPVSIGFMFDTPLLFWGPKPPRPPVSSTIATERELHETVFSASLPRNLTARFTRLGIASLTATTGFPVHAKLDDKLPGASELNAAMLERGRQVRLLNAFALCIHSVITAGPFGYIDATTVTGDSSAILKFDEDQQLISIGGRLRLLARDRRAVRVGNMGGYPYEVMAAAAQLLYDALLIEPDVIPLLSFLNEAAAAFRLHNFAATTIFAWSVCERVQGIVWQRYYTNALGPHGPTSKRKDILNGRDYSASVVISVLELAGIYTTDFARALDRTRKKRNDWIHRGDEPDQNDARLAISSALAALRQAFGIDFAINQNTAFHF